MLLGTTEVQPASPLTFPGGPLDLDSPLYVPRGSLEAIAAQELEKIGCLLRIQAPKRMGKSSFLNRLVAQAQILDYRIVKIDFLAADDSVFTNLDRFLRWLSANVSRQLRQPLNLDEFWDEDLGAKVSCTYYFEDHILDPIDRPIVLALNEVNRVFDYPKIAQDFLPLLRFWNEQAKQGELFQKLRLILVHSTEVYVPLKIHQSPFNIGCPIKLPQFTLEQTRELASRFEVMVSQNDQLEQLLEWIAGSPFRLSLVFYCMRVHGLSLSDILGTLTVSDGIFGQHLQDLWSFLNQSPELCDALRQVVEQSSGLSLKPQTAYKLHSLGLVDLNGVQATINCPLYYHYFEQQFKRLGNLSLEVEKQQYPENLVDQARTQIHHSQSESHQIRTSSLGSCDLVLGGRYEMISKLGAGSFGTTYLAKDIHRPGHPSCVVKKLTRDFEPQELQAARRLFATEAQTLEQLGNHPQIPRLFAYFEQGGDFFLVQEWIDGQLLSDELAESFMLSEQYIIDFLLESLNILEFLHDHQVIHRDIKPENMIRRASDQQLVLIDFGATKLLSPLPQVQLKTVAIGTPGYTPWEQNQGHPQPNSDIYALGVIAIEMATGLMPSRLRCDANLELHWRPFAKRINSWLVSIIDGMVKHNAQERYQTVREVIQDLQMVAAAHG